MAKRNSLLKATFLGGVMFLVPVVVLSIVIAKALGLARQVIVPIEQHLPLKTVLGIEFPAVLAIILILAVCLLAGLVARTAPARSLVGWLESAVLGNLPGYSFMKGICADITGIDGAAGRQVVLARIEEAWQLAFLIERIDGGHVAVVVPGAPSPWSGSVYFMTEDRIRPIDVPASSALHCIKQLGGGGNELLSRFLR